MEVKAEVLGQVRLVLDGQEVDIGGPRQRRLLAALLVHAGLVVSTDRLIEAVFDGDVPGGSRRTFRTYVARLRRAMDGVGLDGRRLVATTSAGYRFVVDEVDCDWTVFETELRDGADQLDAGNVDTALIVLDRALGRWRGAAYGELGSEHWFQAEAQRLEELRTVASELLIRALSEAGRHGVALASAEALIAGHPLREEPRRLQIVTLYRQGRHAEALRAYRNFAERLGDESGLEPSDALAELERMIIDRDPRLEARPAGRKLRGYVLGEPMYQGRSGLTYRATQPSIGRDVAITVIPPEAADDPSFVRDFEMRAQQLAGIEQANVVPLYDYWREPGAAYLVTRLLRGGSLAQRLESEPGLAVDSVVRMVEQVGAALNAAHERGVVHGALLATHVFFDERGNAYLADFALDTDEHTRSEDVAAFVRLAESLWARTGVAPSAANSESPELFSHGLVGSPGEVFRSVKEVLAAFDQVVGRPGMASSTPIDEHLGGSTLIEGPNPYRGLLPFAETDAGVFFGREGLADTLVGRLADDRLLCIAGPSGAGKSSLVRAGMLPRLRRADAFVTTMKPGSSPIAELGVAISRIASSPVVDLERSLTDAGRGLAKALDEAVPASAGTIVLLVDQMEEAFTLSGPRERDLFLHAVATEAQRAESRLRVVLTVRADFIGQVLNHGSIGPLIRDHVELLTPLEPREISEAIVGPAELAGVAVEPALASELVAEAASAFGPLPLLEYALTELYERRVDGTMTLEAYRQLGGLAGVLTQRAEEIYTELSSEDQEAARSLFSRLVVPGEGTGDSRRRAPRSELDGVSDELLETFAGARLLFFDRDPSTREPTVEVAHESLITEWPRLRSWVDENRADLTELRDLSSAAARWDGVGRGQAELYRGARLEAAERLSRRGTVTLNSVERAFIDASRADRDATEARERRNSRRLRILTGLVAAVAVVAVVASVLAVQRQREAERRAVENRVATLVGQSQLAIGEADPDLSILLALAASEQAAGLSDTPPVDVVSSLHTAVQASRLERVLPVGREQLATHPSEDVFAVADGDEVLVLDLDGNQIAARRFGEPLGGLSFSPDGSRLAVTFGDPTNDYTEEYRSSALDAGLIVDGSSLRTIVALEGGLATLRPSWHPDGSTVLASGAFAATRLWNAETGALIRTIPGRGARYAPDLEGIVIYQDGTNVVLSVEGDRIVHTFAQVPVQSDVSGSPNGTTAAIADWNGRAVLLIDLESGQVADVLEHPAPQAVQFSPDGRFLAISGIDDAVQIVDLVQGGGFHLAGHGAGVLALRFANGGRRLVTASFDGSTRIWNMDDVGPEALGNLKAEGPIVAASTAPETSTVIVARTGSDVVTVEVLEDDPASSRPLTELFGVPWHFPVVSADGSLVAGLDSDRVGVVIDVATGQTVLTLRPCEVPRAVSNRLDRVFVEVTSCADLGIEPSPRQPPRRGLVALGSNELVAPVEGGEWIGQGAFGPVGGAAQELLLHHDFFTVTFLNASTNEVLTTWEVGEGFTPLVAQFSADGSTVGLSAQTGQAVTFDVPAILAGTPADQAVQVIRDVAPGPNHRTLPVGDRIYTSSAGAQIRSWDGSTGELLVDVATASGQFAHLFSDVEETSVFYQDAKGVIRRLPVDPDELVNLALSRVQRGFSPEECTRYFPSQPCPDFWAEADVGG
ncbi:MAG: BTAD domain-containing putative transcriptional regulator [Actinomycetota bacterium]